MPKINFTVRALSALPIPAAGRVEYWDSSVDGSFGLRIAATGQKSWVVLYRAGQRQRRFTVGSFDRLPLADARAVARDVLYRASKGEDPAGEKSQKRIGETINDLATEYLERHATVNKRDKGRADRRMLKADVLPFWGSLKAKEIRRRDVIALLDRHVSRGAPILANRVLALVRKMFNFGLQRDIVEFNPCQAVGRPVDEKPRQGQRVLTFDELRSVWPAIMSETPLISAIFQLRVLTAQRGTEIRSIEWSELDFESGWWTIPGTKTKNKLQHRVPLTDQVRAVLQEISWTSAKSRFVFPSPVDPHEHIANIQKAFLRIKVKARVDFSDRDFRRTAASLMTGELGISRLVVSKILNHVESGITKVYDRHGYDAEKRRALDAWGAKVLRVVSTTPMEWGKVFALPGR